LALAPALTFVSWHYSRRFLGDTSLWLLPLFWFSFEWFRGWFLTGMPWLSLGYSQTAAPLSGFAPLIRVYGISDGCLSMAVALFLSLRDRRDSVLAVLLLGPWSGYLLQQIDWTEAQPQSINVSMLQGKIPQAVNWRRDQRHAIFNPYWRETRQLWDSDLILWPETALPGQPEDIESTMLQPLQQAAIDHDTHILAGLVVNESEPNRYYNSMILLGQE
ncbi:MAG: apolipoprotein N-acyltransferase, partial [Gammaproteobacteria bacterium]|nr:apolipoprotein N-acyltransferase [Gammaproteobacteria bacterium]